MVKPKILLTPGKISFAGNDYLCMSKEKRLAEAMYQAALEYGISATSSRWAVGWNQIFENFELALKDHYGTEDAMVFGAAYLGGMIYFGSLKDDCDTVYCDETCHVNLFKGMTTAGMKVITYRHLDTNHLKQLLQSHKGKKPIVATDGVWGISGDIPPLKEISNIAKEFKAELFIDDAHGVFALGKTGRGAAEHCGLLPEDATILGSMSKALGCSGGFLVGRAELVDRFRRNDTTSGSTTSSVPTVAASLKSLEIIRSDPERRKKLFQVADKMREILLRRNIKTADQNSMIIGMCLKDEFEASKLSDHLAKYNVMVPYFKYASEPRHNLLRAVAKSCYSTQELKAFEDAIMSFNA